MRAATRRRLDRVDNDARMALSRAGSGSTLARALEYTFVYRPGAVGPLAPNVFTTWPSLYAALSRVVGPRLVQVDSSLAPATIPAGVYALDQVEFLGTNFASILTFENGASITADTLYFSNLSVFSDSTAPVWSPPNLGELSAVLFAAFTSNPGAAPMFHIGAGVAFNAQFYAATFLGNGADATLSVDAGGSADLIITSQSGIEASSLAGAGTINVMTDGSSFIAQPQAAAALTVVSANANAFSDTNALPIGPSGIVAQGSAPFQRMRGGLVPLTGTIAVTAAGGGGTAITVNLLRDATVLATATVDPGANGHAAASLSVVDAIPDFAPHTYTIEAISLAGTLSVAAKGANVCGHEI